ncbi:MAG: hypothetical protein Q4D37_05020 [Oscillospiraceae bacterium]|nr:hypothetical protein [Oscillospiraceae bacterium]
MQQKSRPEEETFGTPPKSSSGGKKAMLIAAIPTVLLFLGVGLKFARVAQKAERTISHMVDHADSAVTKHSTAATKTKETKTVTTAKTAAADVSNGIYPAGDYEVGVDLPAGTYLAVYSGPSEEQQLILTISSSSDSSDDDAVLNDGPWYPRNTYFQVTDGQFVHVSWANFYNVDTVDVTLEPFQQEGMFLVGKDIPAGTYQMVLDKGEYVYPETAGYTIYSQMASPQPIPKASGSYTDTITLEDGQYIQCKDCHFAKP